MKKTSLKGLLCLGIAAASFAAMPALADMPPAGNWQGGYIGGFVGGTWSDFRHNPGTAGPSGTDANVMGGGDLGYNWQYDHMIIGAEGDFSKLDNHAGTGGVKFTEDWMSTMRGRLGYSIDRFLPYVTGGLGMTDTVSKVAGVGSAGNLGLGPAAGGGVDAMLSDNWFVRAEYLYVDVPKDSSTIGGTTVAGGSGNSTVRLGVNYKF